MTHDVKQFFHTKLQLPYRVHFFQKEETKNRPFTMMRWREMLMDYGQIYGEDGKSKTTRSGSSFFSVDGDLMAKRKADMELRRTLEVHFRPLFQRFVYGGEKIACHDLRRVLKDVEYRSRLPPDKVHELVDVTDFNIGRSIKYEEFVRIVTGKITDDMYSDLGSSEAEEIPNSCLARILPVVCRNTAQQNLVEERLANYRCLPPAIFMLIISVAQIIAYIIYSVGDSSSSLALEGVPVNNSLMYMPARRREAWRFLSYCLLHQGFVDLMFNVVIQIVVGIPLEITYSWWRLSIVYIVGVTMGSVGQSVADQDVGLVGAGGGAYAVLGGHMIAMWQNRKHLNDNQAEGRKIHVLCSVTLRFLVLLVLIMVPQVGLAVYRRWFLDDIFIKIGIFAHVAGFISGLTIGTAFLKDPKLLPWQRGGSGILAFFLFLAALGAAIVFNIASDGYPDEDFTPLSEFVNSP
ncbi:rhomboid-like protein [Plakobranchus ocellatus]|uniref:Rhomboid-like protein n=1 Tax=Plakobranchus ocellatus TaxID=259542 RepID=A0AAV4CDQ4_9GAST|nr:rhomboid-like protein [Plakobranchus ocellatus]